MKTFRSFQDLSKGLENNEFTCEELVNFYLKEIKTNDRISQIIDSKIGPTVKKSDVVKKDLKNLLKFLEFDADSRNAHDGEQGSLVFNEQNFEEILRKVSDSVNPKFEIVIGNNNKAEAKIAGITPAVLILRGRCEDSPPYILFPTCLLG